ncbi:hypothetical protein BH23PAT2_BH23PAT2_03170 [soil metagenome]
MKKNLQNKSSGFTIIEVMIVLAIAALILVVVLIAIPQLQRNQRNAARRDILGRVKTELDNYAGNNNGQYPTDNNNATTGFSNGFRTRYLGCTNATTCGVNINDPRTGRPILMNNSDAIPVMNTAGDDNGGANINYSLGDICAGERPNGPGQARNYAIAVSLEGGASFCLDNR